jgi:dolichyl-phosphate-mannose-protein mannosyltransferase
MAASMLVFGDNGLGWRFPSLIAGMIGLAAVYGIVRATGETARLGVLVVGFLAFENLTFVHGRIGTLDMMSLAAILVGAWLGLRGHWTLAGVACAVGSLVKLTGAFGLLALLTYQVVLLVRARRGERGRLGWDDLRPTLLLVSAYAVVAIAGLWALDLRFSGYGDPWAHLVHMMSFGAALQTTGTTGGIASTPWQWLVNEGHINYLRVAVDTKVNGVVTGSLVKVEFRGALNPILLGALPLGFLFTFWYAWRKGSLLAIWCLAWAAANFLPYLPLAIVSHRIMYLYYFLPTVPALAVAVAILLARSGLPRMVIWGYVAAFMLAFVAFFPFRQLPG